MPEAPRADGPWGEAIRFWLSARKARQADLVRDTGLTANTISKATRGFHTSTRVLAKIAAALHVPMDAILVSPERKTTNEERRRLAIDIAEQVLRTMEARVSGPQPLTTGIDRAATEFANQIMEEAEAEEQRAKEKARKRSPRKDRRKK